MPSPFFNAQTCARIETEAKAQTPPPFSINQNKEGISVEAKNKPTTKHHSEWEPPVIARKWGIRTRKGTENHVMRSIRERYEQLRSKVDSRPVDGLRSVVKGLLGYPTPLEEMVEGPMTRSLSEGLEDGLDVAIGQDMEGNTELVLDSPKIPQALVDGVPLLRITRRKKVQRIFKVDLEKALLMWSNKAVSLDRIQQIRVGDDARNYREEYGVSKNYNDRWATILYKDISTGKLKTLNIIAPSRAEFEVFISTLDRLVTRRRQLMRYLSIPDENFAHIHWKNYIDKEPHRKQCLSFEDIVKLTKRLHINCDEEHLLRIFNDTDSNHNGSLNFEEFQKFVKQLKQRPEIIGIFKTVTKTETISFEQFEGFVSKVQKQSTKGLDKIFTRFTRSTDGVMTIDGFTDFLSSTYSQATVDSSEDLSHPFNEYFISSSHNTYLLGRQFGNSTSIEGYIRALQRGCRSVEIDIWDGDHGPVVSHGKITSSIPLRDVLETVMKYAFILTPFPLFLSLEVHCKPVFQLIVRDLLVEILGDVLVTEASIHHKFKLPSPMDLKHRILVKVKKTSFEDSDVSQSSFSSSSVTSSSTTTTAQEEDEEESQQSKTKIKRSKKYSQIIPELAALGVYSQGLKFINFSLPESKQPNHIFSFSDRNFQNMIKDQEKKYLIQKHNRTFMMRVYPAGYRYNSTNFSPIIPWTFGVQMVATNWQTYDTGQQVNEAMFDCGSKCGYKLKPPELRNIDPFTKFKNIQTKQSYVKFSIEIISGQLLPRPKELRPEDPLSPFVVLEFVESTQIVPLKCTDLDSNTVTYIDSPVTSTKSIKSNGFNPLWKYKVEGVMKDAYGLNFIKFSVKTRDVAVAVNCFKLDNLQQGYRHIPLHDLQGEEYIFSTLFVKLNYETFTK